MSEIIRLEAVSKTYRKSLTRKTVEAIHEVSFSVAEGEAVGFIGHNGAGKSTTIRIIMGLQKPSSGTVLLQGYSPMQPESRRRVAYVPENPLLYDHLSPRELLTFAMIAHGHDAIAREKLCETWLARFSLLDVADKHIRQFSKGMVQRCALAMAMATQPKLLILDEPLSGLDPSGRREVVDILADYRSTGGSLLFSSHVLTDVEVLADRFLFIHKGRIRVSGTPGSLLSGENESFEIIIETRNPPPQYQHMYGCQYKCEVPEEMLERNLAELRQFTGVRLINIRSRNTLESAYFRFIADAESKAPARASVI